MTLVRDFLYHYFLGILFSMSIVLFIILFDYFFNGFLQYPELENFLKVCFISGFPFGLTAYCISLLRRVKNYEPLNLKLVLLFEYFYFERGKNIPYDQLTPTEKKVISRDDYNTIINAIKNQKR